VIAVDLERRADQLGSSRARSPSTSKAGSGQ
jgi:hypothetical protein